MTWLASLALAGQALFPFGPLYSPDGAVLVSGVYRDGSLTDRPPSVLAQVLKFSRGGCGWAEIEYVSQRPGDPYYVKTWARTPELCSELYGGHTVEFAKPREEITSVTVAACHRAEGAATASCSARHTVFSRP
ncbi:hypothetical protein [Thermoactinospora rubra]|uniref:hypothetical protein n=1 Tax=Thermoactinospora rubra TaxID=1088767 RepID=UPI00117C9E35|nr:hypothetical protein [Thermoactinospora rubra]